MKIFKFLGLIIISCLLSISSKADPHYSFKISKSGHGNNVMVFIPGFACSGRVWDETVKQYSDNNTCYILTFAGFAGQKAQAHPDLLAWEEEIYQFLKNSKISNPTIIGHSMGGVMAYLLAADHPDLIAKIVVVDALPCLSAVFNPNFRSQANPDCSGIVAKFNSMTDSMVYALQKQSIPTMLADTSMRDTVIHWTILSDHNTEGLIYCQFANMDVRAKLAAIHCPSLILLESGFKYYNDAVLKQFALLKNTSIHFANKGLHFIMYDDKTWYFSELKAFLN